MAMPVTEVGGVRMVGVGIGFQRIRRITGYLVGTIERFNDAKKMEVRDRVKHNCGCTDREAENGREYKVA